MRFEAILVLTICVIGIYTKNYYEVLGLKPSEATDVSVKKAYRRLVKIFHPDKGGDPDHFILVTKAYESLKTPSLREYYSISMEYDYTFSDRFSFGSQNSTPDHMSDMDIDLKVVQNVLYIVGIIFVVVFIIRFGYFQKRKESVKKIKVKSKKRMIRRANSFHMLMRRRNSSGARRLKNIRKAVLYRRLLMKCREMKYRS